MANPWSEPKDQEERAYEVMPWNEPAECLACGALLSGESATCDICGAPVSSEEILSGTTRESSLQPWIAAGVLQPVTASFRRRLFASLVDDGVVGVLAGLVLSTVGAFNAQLSVLLPLGITALYYIVPYSTTGQTIGKKWLGIRVVAIDGSDLNWRRGINRYLGYIPSSAVFFLGYLWAIWDKDKQAWHDKLASTMVVHTDYPFFPPLDAAAARVRERTWATGMAIGAGCLILAAYAVGALESLPLLP